MVNATMTLLLYAVCVCPIHRADEVVELSSGCGDALVRGAKEGHTPVFAFL